MSIAQSFIPELEQEAATTRRVLERVPGDKLDWRPHAKSMSLGQLALHLAATPGQIAGMAEMDEMPMPDFGPQPAASSTDELIPTLEEGVAKAKEMLGGMDDDAISCWSSAPCSLPASPPQHS